MTMMKTIILYILFSIVFLTSGYALTSTMYSSLIYSLPFFGVILIFFTLLLKLEKKGDKEKSVVIFLIFILLLFSLISTFLNHTTKNVSGFGKFAIVVLFSGLVVYTYSIKRLTNAFLNYIFFLSLVSLVVYLLVNVFLLDISFGKVENVNGVTYNLGYFYFYFDSFLKFRNAGVFWEPGIFATFLLLALFLELHFYHNARKLRVATLIVALITTFSSAGMILLCIYLISLVFKFKVSLRGGAIFLVMILFFMVIGFYYMNLVNDTGVDATRLYNKILNFEKNEDHRINSPIINFEIFSEKPIFGWGLSETLIKYGKLTTVSLTSTSLYYMASFGILGLLLILMPILGFLSIKDVSLSQRLIFILVFFICINKEPHTYFSLTYLIFYVLSLTFAKNVSIGKLNIK